MGPVSETSLTLRILVLGLLTACSSNYASKEDVARLEGRLQALEGRSGVTVASTTSNQTAGAGQKKGPEGAGGEGAAGGEGGAGGAPGGEGGAGGAGGGAADQPSAEMLEMEKSFSGALDAMNKGDQAAAIVQLEALIKNYSDTKAAETAADLIAELKMVGGAAPPLVVDSWIQGQASLTDGKAVLLVFFQTGNNPKLDRLTTVTDAWKPKGLTVIGVTQAANDMPKDKLAEWLSSKGLTFPVALDKGSTTTQAYHRNDRVSGVLIRGGKIVWSGNPGQVTDAILAANIGG